jgi:hypothetical protein
MESKHNLAHTTDVLLADTIVVFVEVTSESEDETGSQ